MRILKTLESANFQTKQGCIDMLDALYKELENQSSRWADTGMPPSYRAMGVPAAISMEDVKREFLSFIQTAMEAISQIPKKFTRKADILGRLEVFLNKILDTLREYAMNFEVVSYSVTIGISPSVTLTFRP
jgi:hypothetical protein